MVDGDDSMDLGELPKLLQAVVDEGVTMAVGRRRPVSRGVWPWHARAGTTLLATWLRRSSGFGVHDLAPMRVCRRDDLIALDIRDRRFGYPLELMVKAARAGWTVREIDIAYRPRAAGTRSKVSGSLRGTTQAARDFLAVLAMSRPTVLVVAKAPVPGLAKTRIAADGRHDAAADLAAAALLDTLDTAVGSGMTVVVALTGDLDRAARADELRAVLAGLVVVPQVGTTFGERLAQAHLDADGGHGVVQVGMDSPQLRADDLPRPPTGSPTTRASSVRPRTVAGGCSGCAAARTRPPSRRSRCRRRRPGSTPARSCRRRPRSSAPCATWTPGTTRWPSPTEIPHSRFAAAVAVDERART